MSHLLSSEIQRELSQDELCARNCCLPSVLSCRSRSSRYHEVCSWACFATEWGWMSGILQAAEISASARKDKREEELKNQPLLTSSSFASTDILCLVNLADGWRFLHPLVKVSGILYGGFKGDKALFEEQSRLISKFKNSPLFLFLNFSLCSLCLQILFVLRFLYNG